MDRTLRAANSRVDDREHSRALPERAVEHPEQVIEHSEHVRDGAERLGDDGKR
jgi:hypothetical protein